MKDAIKQKNGTLIIALSRALQVLHRRSEVLFRENGLTRPQFEALEALLHKGDLTVGALIEAVLSSSGNMTVVLRNLEKQDLVRRLENPIDRRSYLITLTDSGRALISSVFVRHMALVEEAVAPLSSEEKKTIIRILCKLG